MPRDAAGGRAPAAAGPKAGIGERIGSAVSAIGTQRRAAEAIGVSLSQLRRYINGTSAIPLEVAARLADAAGVTLDWLVRGDEHSRERPSEPLWPQPGIPVIGLAECGQAGWYREQRMAITTKRPLDLVDPNAVAVIAVGASLAPAGILPGHMCLASPATPPDEGDIVFVEQVEGRASLRIYEGREGDWVLLGAWLPPDETGRQERRTEQVRDDRIRTLATVIYVKRKL